MQSTEATHVKSGRDEPISGAPSLTFSERELQCQLTVIEEAKELGMTASDYRKACANMILEDEATPGDLISQGLAQRLNIIFDIDNTLVHSVSASQAPPQLHPDAKRFDQVLSDGQVFHFAVFIRQGVREMLDTLSEFCTFYVYSHGMMDYINNILNLLDPNLKWFQERHKRVIAPRDLQERERFTREGKSAAHFASENMKEGGDWLVIDDQFGVIHEKNHLVLSKKYFKDLYTYEAEDHPKNAFQFPHQDQLLAIHDLSGFYVDNNVKGARNQIYYLSVLITRMFLQRFAVFPYYENDSLSQVPDYPDGGRVTPTLVRPKSFDQILLRYQRMIFKDVKFYFGNFDIQVTDPKEKQSANNAKKFCLSLVNMLGGKEHNNLRMSDYEVFYKDSLDSTCTIFKRPAFLAGPKSICFKYITECYFNWIRFEDTEYLIAKKDVDPKKGGASPKK
ncbi:hypothetical protein FGO68_gene12471 [Halteria grandinella]|uniref:protein-serine/threonine phosphatase n=1 Tax=Halteria grandinella TaxID=5974 RepID=A0A8J8NSL3_HALGN|nr:hypothetical protein FGO68_gene12471 [Halteria grandinella]